MSDVLDPAEHALQLRARAGDRDAFGELISRHMRRAYCAALGLVGSHDDALDLSQEAFARAFRNRKSFDPERSFYGWVYQILRRLCFNFLRDSKNRRRRLEERSHWLVEEVGVSVMGGDPERHVELNDMRDSLEAAIKQLSEREREVIVLKEFEGLRYREIADLLDVPVGTVMSRLYAARRSLASVLEERP